mmetsp:Transcript_95326/g.132395  ORF Transcript_95326/g.132395 Transcript_95326/m.132395 type:complete len:115 (+) Transcript_95326:107-451(+)
MCRFFFISLCILASAILSNAERSGSSLGSLSVEVAHEDDRHEEWPSKTPNCLQPCGKGCFCMAAKHYHDIFFCDCTGRSQDTERIYRQEMAYADVIKHPDKQGQVNPEWSKKSK